MSNVLSIKTTVVKYRAKPPVVASIDFDNNNASILYNSIKGEYVEQS